VNRSPSFAAVNNTPPIKRENENGSSTPKNIAPYPGKDKVDAKLTPLTNGHSSHPLKRTISHDSLAADSQSDSLELDASGRRSKRLRKGPSKLFPNFSLYEIECSILIIVPVPATNMFF